MISTKDHKQEGAEQTKEHLATPEKAKEDGSAEVGGGGEVGEDVEMSEVAGQGSEVEQANEASEIDEDEAASESGEDSANETKKKIPDYFLGLLEATLDKDGNPKSIGDNLEDDGDDSDWSVGRTSPTWNAPKPFEKSDALYKKFPEKVKNPKSEEMSWDAEELFKPDNNPKPEKKDDDNA